MRYRDAVAALDWLERAFGLERQFVVPGPDGTIAHAQMRFGNGMIMLGSTRYDLLGNARSGVYVYVADVDAHATRTRRAGARIELEPHDATMAHANTPHAISKTACGISNLPSVPVEARPALSPTQ